MPPDRVVVWNEHQKGEAGALHGIPPARVVVTGAQLFDHWFEMKPREAREAFLARSAIWTRRARSFSISAPLRSFARRKSAWSAIGWERSVVRATQSSPRPTSWCGRTPRMPVNGRTRIFSDLGNVAIWPRGGAVPMDQDRKQAYFDSLHHAAAVVGINTSGFLEAAILGRRTLILHTPQTMPAQEGTLHLRYLLEDGFLLSATGMPAHLAQLGRVLRGADAAEAQEPLRRFVGHFLRPHGLDRPALPRLVAAVELLGRLGRRQPAALSWWTWLVRAVAAPLTLVIGPRYRAVLARREGGTG